MAVTICMHGPSPIWAPARFVEDQRLIFDIGRHFDIAPDGRFLMVKDTAFVPVRQINGVSNWGEELAERVPAN